MLHRTTRIVLLIGLLVFVVPHFNVAAYPEEGQTSIVLDMSHDQPLSHLKRNFTQAIDFFQNHTEFFVRIHTNGELAAHNLSRVHILVVPNPGRNFSSQELEVITAFVEAGGALFLLGDYQTEELRIGNPEALNEILGAISENRIRFTTFQHENEIQGDAIIDNSNNITLSHNVVINGSGITAETREAIGSGVERVIIAGGSLTGGGGLVVSQGAPTSQAVTIDGQIIQQQPAWLAAFWIGDARIVLCSSTTMFSNTLCAGLNRSWFQAENNAVLWYNIFKWMSRSLIHDPTPIMVVFVALALLVGTGLFAYVLWLKKRGR